jgi:hypothetical protein
LPASLTEEQSQALAQCYSAPTLHTSTECA